MNGTVQSYTDCLQLLRPGVSTGEILDICDKMVAEQKLLDSIYFWKAVALPANIIAAVPSVPPSVASQMLRDLQIKTSTYDGSNCTAWCEAISELFRCGAGADSDELPQVVVAALQICDSFFSTINQSMYS